MKHGQLSGSLKESLNPDDPRATSSALEKWKMASSFHPGLGGGGSSTTSFGQLAVQVLPNGTGGASGNLLS